MKPPNISQQHNLVEEITAINAKCAQFWNASQGWAPSEVADILTKSRLDWQVSLSKTLNIWMTVPEKEMDSGKLILAWVNLGALVEGTLKLYLCVFYKDFLNDIEAAKESGAYDNRKKKIKKPDGLQFDNLRRFLILKELIDEEESEFLDLVQRRRNAIHAFKHRELGDKQEFLRSVQTYYCFLQNIEARLPYPD